MASRLIYILLMLYPALLNHHLPALLNQQLSASTLLRPIPTIPLGPTSSCQLLSSFTVSLLLSFTQSLATSSYPASLHHHLARFLHQHQLHQQKNFQFGRNGSTRAFRDTAVADFSAHGVNTIGRVAYCPTIAVSLFLLVLSVFYCK